ncbi:CLUMA_CG001848, isoform A [Clunio marinus]|uniref:CLUMA_CG001848, isoform A n=1 Tax=Clunio marinus TaxID=568069 RepID=A0A1J1HJ64_9DIPT|nr:CLUMA_CG001848, isoform A [Clunio marinus]
MHGLSTLNRLLGKKNKEGSRTSNNLSKSTTNLDTSSQHNKITPIVVNNAPFEQTFRVTVYLPKNQLYVERIGAKTKLSTLMERICENKHLIADKVEFRHPGDMSQVFDNDKTIGEVGLNELKLVLKTESHFNTDFRRFHADDVIKYKSTVPESVSSSEISRNYNKKPSPYSSTTSLNSLDSTGMNSSGKIQPPVAPARKKRAAPRPPSQNSIPEQEIFSKTLNVFKEPHSILPMKNFHVSSPQLNNNHLELKSDKNNNNIEREGNRLNAITRPTSMYVTNTNENVQNNSNGHHQRTSSESSEVTNILHERQNSNSFERKKKPAPVPPKRVHKPVPSPRTVQDELKSSTITEIKEMDDEQEKIDSSCSRSDEMKVVVESSEKTKVEEKSSADNGNVSKTMLNNVQKVEDFSSMDSTSDGPISIQIISNDSSIDPVTDEMTLSSHNSSKLPSTVSKVHIKLDDESRRSSSEDEMTVNIYNVTKSVVKVEKPKNEVIVETKEIVEIIQETQKEVQERPQSPLWTYTLPAPPKINDDESDKSTEVITSDLEDGYLGNGKTIVNVVSQPSQVTIEKKIQENEVTVESFQRSRLLISRSDSFHSIGQGRKNSYDNHQQGKALNTPQRSTSFLSLIQSQKSEVHHHNKINSNNDNNMLYNRQRSTSELSISDVPSLQSIEVLKNILNSSSRKESLPNEMKIDVNEKKMIEKENVSVERQTSFEMVKKQNEIQQNSTKIVEKKVEEVKFSKPVVVVESKQQPTTTVVETTTTPAKPTENQWRYRGPPKINLSTWNERPTSKVIIAADSDYKFGGVANPLPSEIKRQQQQQDITSKRHTIHISDETIVKKEVEKHLPKVLGVEYKKDLPSAPSSVVTLRNPSSEIVTKSTSKTTIINIKPRPMSMEVSNNYSTLAMSTDRSPTQQSSIAYNRLNSNAKKFTPVVHGFKLNNIKESDHVDSSSQVVKKDVEKKMIVPPSVPAKPAFLRSTSAGDITRPTKLSVAEIKLDNNSDNSPALDFPFSQTSLRRTGLKEKILSTDKETKSMFGKVVEPKPEVVIRYHNNNNNSNGEKMFERSAARQLSQPVPVPPKPPTTASMNFRKSAPVTGMETRNQLLDAIKNFDKDSLRRK